MSEPVDGKHLSDLDRRHLRRCVELARESLDSGNRPYGSLLVDADGTVRVEMRNAVNDVDETHHPEFEIARWAAANLTPDERLKSTVYTSGEHCPMCSAAHAWVGLGPIVYASSAAQRASWYSEWGIDSGPVEDLPINQVAPAIAVAGPDLSLADEIRALHARLLSIDWQPDGPGTT